MFEDGLRFDGQPDFLNYLVLRPFDDAEEVLDQTKVSLVLYVRDVERDQSPYKLQVKNPVKVPLDHVALVFRAGPDAEFLQALESPSLQNHVGLRMKQITAEVALQISKESFDQIGFRLQNLEQFLPLDVVIFCDVFYEVIELPPENPEVGVAFQVGRDMQIFWLFGFDDLGEVLGISLA